MDSNPSLKRIVGPDLLGILSEGISFLFFVYELVWNRNYTKKSIGSSKILEYGVELKS